MRSTALRPRRSTARRVIQPPRADDNQSANPLPRYRFGGSDMKFAVPDLPPWGTAPGPDGEFHRREWNDTELVPHICVLGEYPDFIR